MFRHDDHGTIRRCHRAGLGIRKDPPPFDDVDFCPLQQARDTTVEPLDDAILPPHGLRQVKGWGRREADADIGQPRLVRHLREPGCRVDQRLGRDAADVKAGAAQPVSLDQDRIEAELSGADRRDIAAGAAAEDKKFRLQACHGDAMNRRAGCSSRARMS